MASQGQYTYTINVKGAAQAIKEQTKFAKEVEKSTKATEDQLKKRETGNARLAIAVNKTRKEFNKSVTAASKFKDQTVQGAKEAAAKVEHLNKKLTRTTEALRKGRKEAKDFAREFTRLGKLQTPGPAQITGPGRAPGIPAPRPASFMGKVRGAVGTPFAGVRGAMGPGGGLGPLATTLGAGAALSGSVGASVDLEQQQLKLSVLSREYGEYSKILKLIESNQLQFNKSQRDATQEFANVYARLRPLGFELSKIQTVYKGFNAVALASGASANESRVAFQQLAQALGSGRLQGDEFRSIAEQIPGILVPVAQEMGVTVGELKKLGSEGKITSEVLVGALSRGFDANSEKIKELIALSPSQTFQSLRNSIDDAAISIGDALLPVVEPLVKLLTNLLNTLNDLPKPLKTFGAVAASAGLGVAALAGAVKLLGFASAAALIPIAILAAKIALIAAPFVLLAASIQDATRKKQEFDDALNTEDVTEVDEQVKKLQETTVKYEKALSNAKKAAFYRGQEAEIKEFQRKINELKEKIDELTKRRKLIIDVIIPNRTIGGIEYETDGKSRLTPVNAPETVSDRREREEKEANKAREEAAKKAAKDAPRIAKIYSDARLRNEQLLARQTLTLVRQRFQIESKLLTERHRLAESLLTGEARTQLGIINSFVEANRAIDAQVEQLDANITAAENRLRAAQARLDAASDPVDRARAQAGVTRAQTGLTGAQDQREQFAGETLEMRNNALGMMVAQTTAGFRERAAGAKLEAQALRERNRLMLEGFSPEQIERLMAVNEIDRVRTEKVAQLNEGLISGKLNQDMYNIAVADLDEAAQAATTSINELSEAQAANNSKLAGYVSSNLQYLGDIEGRMVDMAGMVESSLGNAINDVVSGTATIGEAFQNFFADIGKSFLKLATQMIAKLILISVISAATGMPAGALMSGGGGGGAGGGGLLGFLSGLFGGGEKKMAKGGIVTRPTRALIGEGGMNEAVVPLPDGKSIPIDMGKKSAGSNVNTNITVNVDQGGNASTDTEGDNANKLGLAIDSAVKRVIMDERRSGGLLYNGRR